MKVLVKLVGKGMETLTGTLGGVQFNDGTSIGAISQQAASLFAAVHTCDIIDADNPASVQRADVARNVPDFNDVDGSHLEGIVRGGTPDSVAVVLGNLLDNFNGTGWLSAHVSDSGHSWVEATPDSFELAGGVMQVASAQRGNRMEAMSNAEVLRDYAYSIHFTPSLTVEYDEMAVELRLGQHVSIDGPEPGVPHAQLSMTPEGWTARCVASNTGATIIEQAAIEPGVIVAGEVNVLTVSVDYNWVRISVNGTPIGAGSTSLAPSLSAPYPLGFSVMDNNPGSPAVTIDKVEVQDVIA